MKSATRPTAIVLASVLISAVAAGCGDSAVPTRPEPIPAHQAASALVPAGGEVQDSSLPGGERASGHVVVHGTEVQGVKDESYSFSARRDGSSPLATGILSGHFLRFDGQEIKVEAEVTCLAVADNQAWVGTRLTRLVRDGVDLSVEGLFPIFRVLDVGEGQDAVDQASLLFFASKDTPRFQDEMSYCQARPDFPKFFESANANIQVMQ